MEEQELTFTKEGPAMMNMNDFGAAMGLLQLYVVFVAIVNLLPILVGVGVYFMARARERQTGQAQFPGRSAVVFTLLNLGAYMIYGGLMMMLNNIVISAGGENPDYTAFKLGISILLPGAAAIAVMVRLWSYWTRGESCLSTHNLFVKVYSGINVLWNGCVSLVMAAALCFFVSQSGEGGFGWETVKEPFKMLSVSLVLTLAFLACNLIIFGRCRDASTSTNNDEVAAADPPSSP